MTPNPLPQRRLGALYFGPENLANTIHRVDKLKKICPQA